MRVSVVFRNTPVLVPVGEGRMKISDLIEMAITRYKKTDSRLSEYTITVRSLRLFEGGSFVDLDDEVADVLDDKEVVLADFDLIGDSLSTSSQESNSVLPSSGTLAGRVQRAHSNQPEGASNLLTVPSSSNPSLADHDDSISSDMPPWTPSTSASVVAENDIPDVIWRQEQRTNTAGRSNRSGSFASSQSGRFTPADSSLAREMAIDGPLQSNRSSFAESLSDRRLRLSLSDARSRNSYAGPGIYERERLYDDHYPPRRFRNKPYHLMESNMSASPSDYMRYRYRSHRLEGYNQRLQERPPHGMFPHHGSASNILQQTGRLGTANEDGNMGYQGRFEEPVVDFFLSQPQYSHEHHNTNEPSGYALSQPAFRSVRPSVVHAADLDPNSEAPHLRHLSQDDHSSRSDTPTYRSSPVPEGMRLDAATYHGNRMLRFSDNEDDDYSDHGREDQVGKQQLMSRYVPFQRNKRFSIQRDGLVYARWAEYCENSGIPESDEEKDDESVRHVGHSPNSSREELSYHGNRGGRTSSPVVNQQERVSERSQMAANVQSATESESEDDLGNIHIIELHKGSHKLGIVIKKCSADNKDLGIFVDAMETEGFAAASQKLQINDRILACNGCDFTKLSNQKAESTFKEMMDEPLLRMAISRGNHFPVSGEGSDVSDYHHGDGDSTVDGSDPGYSVTNTREIGVIHDIKIVKGNQGLGFGVTTRDVASKTIGPQPIYIKNITKDGPAFKDGRLRLGDRLLKVNDVTVEQMTQAQVVHLMRSLPQGPVTLQVSRQETRLPNDDNISVLEVPTIAEHDNDTTSNVGVGSGRTVMTFDISMHQSDTASLGVTVHGKTRQNSPSHSSKNADIGIYIKSIVPKGLAAMDGRVQPGDQVLCVNGHNLLGQSNSDAMTVLKKALGEINPGSNSIQLVISRKTTTVPMKSPVAPTAAVANYDQQINEVGIDVGNAVMATPNSQSSQSSAGVVRIESTESLSSRRRNESEPLSKYSLEKSHVSHERGHGSHDPFAQQAAAIRNSMLMAGKPPVKRSSSESRYDNRHLQSEFISPRNSSSSGSGLISPTGVTLSLAGSHDNNFLSSISKQNYRQADHRSNHTTDMFTSSTPIHREQFPTKSNVDYPSYSLPRSTKPRKREVSPSPQLESSGSTGELAAGAYFRRDAPGRISIKKGKQGPQRDFSQFNFRNSEPKVEGDDSSSVDMMRTGSAESILANRSPVLYKVPVGPHLGLAKSSSLESLQTILATQRLTETTDELALRSREARSSFRKAVDKTQDDDEVDHALLDPSFISYTKNPKNKAKRRGFLKSLFRKGKAKRFSSLGDHHGDITESTSSQIDFDPTPPARVELRPHPHGNTNSGSSNKLYQRYSMSVLDNMEFEDDDITATIADV